MKANLMKSNEKSFDDDVIVQAFFLWNTVIGV